MSDTDKTIQEAIDQLRAKHIRITPQRTLVLTCLITQRNHPTVETIYSAINHEEPSLSLATVYNTLKLFVDQGMVLKLSGHDESIHYDYYGSPHYHVICTNCGKIIDVTYPDFAKDLQKIDRIAAEQTGYKITGNHVEVQGLCEDCQKKLANQKN